MCVCVCLCARVRVCVCVSVLLEVVQECVYLDLPAADSATKDKKANCSGFDGCVLSHLATLWHCSSFWHSPSKCKVGGGGGLSSGPLAGHERNRHHGTPPNQNVTKVNTLRHLNIVLAFLLLVELFCRSVYIASIARWRKALFPFSLQLEIRWLISSTDLSTLLPHGNDTACCHVWVFGIWSGLLQAKDLLTLPVYWAIAQRFTAHTRQFIGLRNVFVLDKQYCASWTQFFLCFCKMSAICFCPKNPENQEWQ